ncbi:MAG: SusC/RagA family TonB-linked outer membrane protein [Chitinophagaceae bacterium]|nr:SusC/RagA family TonB-linked outer membrane protein [Chitinophagaceae bacterium]
MKKIIIHAIAGLLWAACNLFCTSVSAQTSMLLSKNDTSGVNAVSGETLYKTPVPNLTNTLYGRLPGLFVKQGSGEPGYDGATLSIRGWGTYDNGSLVIYVDGFQTASSFFQYLSPAEIESISVLKDPVTLATFGMKGANGVLWVVTKRGAVRKSRVQVQAVTGLQQAIGINKPYRSYDYARLYNEAVSNDNYSLNGYQFNWTPAYTDAQLQAYKNGTGTDVDWYDRTLKKNGLYTDANVVFSGGDTTTKYGLVFDYMQQGGLYDVANTNSTSNARIQRYQVRSNLDFNFFKIFEARVDLGGRIEDRRYPNYNGPQLWQNMSTYPSNIYPVKDPATGGWSGTTIYSNNPVASLRGLGWASTHDRTLQANFNLKEKLDFITPGLYLNEAVSFNTWSRVSTSKTATYSRYYNGVQTTTDKTTDITANASAPTDQYDWKQVNLSAGYDRTIGVHAFSGVLNYYASNFITDYGTNNPGLNTGNNIFYHFVNMGGRLHYAYDARYLLDFSFGWSGSDNYAPGHRWGFYPAVGAGWVVSNESFLKDNATVSFLKLRVSAGKSGNDQSNNGRYLYQQYYFSGGTYFTGTSLTPNTGVIPGNAASPDIFAEKSMKYNAGLDITVWKNLSFTLDVFEDKRSGIITQNNNLMLVYGAALPYSNIGKMTNKGFEVSARYSNQLGPVGYMAGIMASYARNRIDFQAEIPTVNSFNKTTGLPLGAQMGLVANGFYDITDFNADGTLKAGIPTPAFGAVQPGDLKYADLDHSGKVDQNDITKIGDPNYASLNYAFNAGLNFKGFDMTALFQGAAGSSVNLLSTAYYQTVAFAGNINVYPIAKNAWAYYPGQNIDTRAIADYPRLSTQANTNNYRASSFWIKKGSFIRLRNIELGYNLPAAVLKRMRLEKLRVYVNAVNPVSWSYLNKHYNIDPETNAGYPGLKSYNAGISLTF